MSLDVVELLAQIHDLGRAEDGSYWRFSLTEVDTRLRSWFTTTARSLGLTLTRDAGGVSASIDPINWDTTLHLKTLRGTLTDAPVPTASVVASLAWSLAIGGAAYFLALRTYERRRVPG